MSQNRSSPYNSDIPASLSYVGSWYDYVESNNYPETPILNGGASYLDMQTIPQQDLLHQGPEGLLATRDHCTPQRNATELHQSSWNGSGGQDNIGHARFYPQELVSAPEGPNQVQRSRHSDNPASRVTPMQNWEAEIRSNQPWNALATPADQNHPGHVLDPQAMNSNVQERHSTLPPFNDSQPVMQNVPMQSSIPHDGYGQSSHGHNTSGYQYTPPTGTFQLSPATSDVATYSPSSVGSRSIQNSNPALSGASRRSGKAYARGSRKA